jgi:LCP family protein required for cell wall assembly
MMQQSMSPLPSRSARKAKKKLPFAAKIVLAIVILCAVAVGGFLLYTYWKAEQMLDNMRIDRPEGQTPAEEQTGNKTLSILLLGLDNRGSGSLNTDVIMVFALDPAAKTATVVSIPRDSYMEVDGYSGGKANGFLAKAHFSDKDEHEEVKRMFSEYLEIPIDYVSIVNFKTFEDVIDALGGLYVDVDMDMRYIDRAGGVEINLKQGPQVLSGKEALDFVRYRQSNAGTRQSSDMERNERQQKVIQALVDKVKSPSFVLNIGEILEAVGENVKTDIPESELKRLVKAYVGVSNEQINYIRLQGVWRSPYIYLNEEEFAQAKQLLRQQLGLEELEYESSL